MESNMNDISVVEQFKVQRPNRSPVPRRPQDLKAMVFSGTEAAQVYIPVRPSQKQLSEMDLLFLNGMGTVMKQYETIGRNDNSITSIR